jgi:hypothetical protein
LPVFVSDEGRTMAPAARSIWDRLIEHDAATLAFRAGAVVGSAAVEAYELSRSAAESLGTSVYEELRDAHAARLERERTKLEQSYGARRQAIERVGLPQVRQHRLAQLERERQEQDARLDAKSRAVPDLAALMLVRIAASGESA